MKRGQWTALDQFDKMILKWERYSYRSGGMMPVNAGFGSNVRTNDAYSVYLVDTGEHIRVELGDFDTHPGAKKFMAKYSAMLGLSAEDKYLERLESAKRTREEVESRRRR